MNAAFDIPEIVTLFCGAVDTGNNPHAPTGNGDLAALSRVCRVFLEPALDALWARQTSLHPLIASFPRDLWTDEYDMDLARPIYPSDWERPMFYARRVKHLSLIDNSSLPDDTILDALTVSLPGGTDILFPNLRALDWRSNMAPEQFPCLRYLLGPRLLEIAIDVPGDLVSLSLLPTIPSRCPNLVCVEVVSEESPLPSHAEFRDAVSLLVRGLQRAESLRIVDVDHRALAYLAQLSGLKDLCITWAGHVPLGGAPPGDEEGAFASLTELKLFASTLEITHALLRATAHAPLKMIELDTSFACPPQAFAGIMDRICSRAKKTLAHIYINSSRHASDSDRMHTSPHLPLASDDTARLTASFLTLIESGFDALRRLEIYCPGSLDLTDGLLLDIAGAWGGTLQHLQLQPEELAHESKDVTLSGVYELVQRCPRLSYLTLRLDATRLPPAVLMPASEELLSLEVCDSPIEDPEGVARFLTSAFPSLKVLRYYSDDMDVPADAAPQVVAAKAFEKRWEKVQMLLKDGLEPDV
ncbi:hypothetical protein MKEN_00990500 [Mycena kentingensis (nom. inval.)]|nr:hypothetical protein MKEN_00990500 [Mycena kentingensis (nom. inval.)]